MGEWSGSAQVPVDPFPIRRKQPGFFIAKKEKSSEKSIGSQLASMLPDPYISRTHAVILLVGNFELWVIGKTVAYLILLEAPCARQIPLTNSLSFFSIIFLISESKARVSPFIVTVDGKIFRLPSV